MKKSRVYTVRVQTVDEYGFVLTDGGFVMRAENPDAALTKVRSTINRRTEKIVEVHEFDQKDPLS